MEQKKKYNVDVSLTVYVTYNVEAENEAEAQELANKMYEEDMDWKSRITNADRWDCATMVNLAD